MLDTEIEDSREGRVQICYENMYGTICDDYWDTLEARLVCEQLGFTGIGSLCGFDSLTSRLSQQMTQN